MPRVHVTSEIGALRSVLVHTPGKELVAVTPGTREDYLYDDIIDLEIAQREHRRLVAVLERFAEVHEVRDTLVEIAGRPEVREFLTTRALEVIRYLEPQNRLPELARAVELVTPAGPSVAPFLSDEPESGVARYRELAEDSFLPGGV